MAMAAEEGAVYLDATRRARVRVPCGKLSALETAGDVEVAPAVAVAAAGYSVSENSWGVYLVWFIVATLIIWIILYLLRPAFLQTRNPDGSYTGQVDTGKALGAAVVFGLLIVLLVWLARRA